MKKQIARVLSAVLALSLLLSFCLSASAAQESDLLARIREKGYIVIATEGDWAPWTYHDESNALVGFDVELGRKLAEYMDPRWGVDMIIGGHSHTFMDSPEIINGIPVVQAGKGTGQIGRFAS